MPFGENEISELRKAITAANTVAMRQILSQQYEFNRRDDVTTTRLRDEPKAIDLAVGLGFGGAPQDSTYSKKGIEVLAVRHNDKFRELLELARTHSNPMVYQSFVDHFRGSDLRGADFSRLNLAEVDFTMANLERVNFSGAQLTGTRFAVTNARQANFTDAEINYSSAQIQTSFEGADLRGATITPDLLYKTYYYCAQLPNDKDYYTYISGDVLRDTLVAIEAMKKYANENLQLPLPKSLEQQNKIDKNYVITSGAKTKEEQLIILKRDVIYSLVDKLKDKHKEIERAANVSNYGAANKARNEFMQILLEPKNVELFAKTRNDMSWKRIVGSTHCV